MTLNYFPQEEEWEADEWFSSYDTACNHGSAAPELPIDIVALAAAILVIIALASGLGHLFKDSGEQIVTQPTIAKETIKQEKNTSQPASPVLTSPTSIIAPYDQYILTQGVHGQSYGHMAIDIAAGKGETIKSPIHGVVSQYYFDAIGNPTLVIENDQYRVTLLHGNYTVAIGDILDIGDPVGTEGNLGNTRDMQGRSCRDRDCGYHTHLNVFDKDAGTNINPLNLISDF